MAKPIVTQKCRFDFGFGSWIFDYGICIADFFYFGLDSSSYQTILVLLHQDGDLGGDRGYHFMDKAWDIFQRIFTEKKGCTVFII